MQFVLYRVSGEPCGLAVAVSRLKAHDLTVHAVQGGSLLVDATAQLLAPVIEQLPNWRCAPRAADEVAQLRTMPVLAKDALREVAAAFERKMQYRTKCVAPRKQKTRAARTAGSHLSAP